MTSKFIKYMLSIKNLARNSFLLFIIIFFFTFFLYYFNNYIFTFNYSGFDGFLQINFYLKIKSYKLYFYINTKSLMFNRYIKLSFDLPYIFCIIIFIFIFCCKTFNLNMKYIFLLFIFLIISHFIFTFIFLYCWFSLSIIFHKLTISNFNNDNTVMYIIYYNLNIYKIILEYYSDHFINITYLSFFHKELLYTYNIKIYSIFFYIICMSTIILIFIFIIFIIKMFFKIFILIIKWLFRKIRNN
jgi:hypothetical protein